MIHREDHVGDILREQPVPFFAEPETVDDLGPVDGDGGETSSFLEQAELDGIRPPRAMRVKGEGTQHLTACREDRL